MNRSIPFFHLTIIFISLVAFGEAQPPSSPSPPKTEGMTDPRSILLPSILFHHHKPSDGLRDPLLIFARWDIKPPNQILGVEGSFDDDQIIAGLRTFYREWKPAGRDEPPPQIILAIQNWGSCGARLFEALEPS